MEPRAVPRAKLTRKSGESPGKEIMKIYLKEKPGGWKSYMGNLNEGDLKKEIEARSITIRQGAIIDEGVAIGDGVTINKWATINKGAVICKGATIGGESTIGKEATIGEETIIYECATIGEGAVIGEWVTIAARVIIPAKATIGNGVKISTSYDCVVLGPLGSRESILTSYMHDGELIVATGCFIGKIDAFEAAVKKQHAGTQYEKKYLLAIDYLRSNFFQTK